MIESDEERKQTWQSILGEVYYEMREIEERQLGRGKRSKRSISYREDHADESEVELVHMNLSEGSDEQAKRKRRRGRDVDWGVDDVLKGAHSSTDEESDKDSAHALEVASSGPNVMFMKMTSAQRDGVYKLLCETGLGL